MTDQITPGSSEGIVHEETVVEYVDNSRRRALFAAILLILFILLFGLSYIVLRLNRPTAPPKPEDLPAGVSWVQSIYAFGTGSTQLLNGPVDTDIAPDGTIWVTTNKRVLAAFGPNGQVRTVVAPQLSGKPGDFISVEGLSVAENGDVYVCDFGKNKVMVFDENGTFLREWGVELPTEIDVRDGKVAVAAAYGIGIFTTEGDLITKWGKRGSGDADLDLPHGIVLGDDGNVYVSDSQNHRIKAYSQQGRLLWTRASKAKTGLKSKAESDTVGGVNQNMQIPAGMTFDGAGRLLAVDPFEFQVLVMDTTKKGQVIKRYGRFGAEDGRFAYPTGISYDQSRDWFAVADTANNRVQIIRLPGSGGNALRSTLARVGDQPWWLCSIPLLLLLAAIVVWLTRRRREREAKNSVQSA